MFLDELTSNLDLRNQQEVLKTIINIAETNKCNIIL